LVKNTMSSVLLVDADRRGLDDQAGGLAAGIVGVERGDGAQLVGVLLDGRDELGVLVADVDVDELAGEVEVLGAVLGPEVAALGAGDDRRVQSALRAPRVEDVLAVVGEGIGGVACRARSWAAL
jgi:hypothetical protein